MEATYSHPVAEVTVFSKQRARRRRRTRWPWATSTRQAWRMGRKTLAPRSLRGGSSQQTRHVHADNALGTHWFDHRVRPGCGRLRPPIGGSS
jgi:hypothetical protein